MEMTSNKSYIVRAIYDWIVDNNLTPYIVVQADYPGVQVPEEYVKQGKIILNLSMHACRGLHLTIDMISFTARFSGVIEQIAFSPLAVTAVYAKENGRGMEFEIHYPDAKMLAEMRQKTPKKPILRLVDSKKDIN